METRKLGATDLELTPIGLGTWAIGGPWSAGWGPQDDRDSIATIREALDLGINWIDTAPVYGLGHSESVVGEAIRGHRERVIIATKCGQVWEDSPSDKVTQQLKAWSIRKEVEDSLRRLDVDCIDLYQIHWPRPDEDIEEAWEEIARLLDEKKIRYAGVCNFTVEQLDRIRAIAPVASLQPPYSMFTRRIEDGLTEYCAANGIGMVVYGTLQFGLLTGKFTDELLASLPDDDWRHRNRHFQGEQFQRHLRVVEELKAVARSEEMSLAELAIAWVLRRTEVTSAIVGARRPTQISETAPASSIRLSPRTIDRIEAVLAE